MKDCTGCGKCCVIYGGGGLSASKEEIEYWENNRPDIASHVGSGKIWIDPATGEQMLTCPWLEKVPDQDKYLCRIYHDRPDDCRYYPVHIDEMIRDGCEMLESEDFAHPKAAQKRLDYLMADSRKPRGSG
jgi:Fe-S-cluster containining protein